jgi:membrane-anchored glycerophosphoryl diester phosphodiesterase (GDPDase)
MDTVQIVLIIGIAIIVLALVLAGGRTLWDTVNKNANDLIKK